MKRGDLLRHAMPFYRVRRKHLPERDEVIGGWRKLHNEELHNVYCSRSIIRNIKSGRMRWAGHVARMGEKMNIYRILVGTPEGDHYEDLDVDGRIILERILERSDGVVWAGLIWLRIGTSGGPLWTRL
jgi:hypothetical protein